MGKGNESELKNDVILLTCVLEKLLETSIEEPNVNPLYCVSSPDIPGYVDWKSLV